MAQTQSPNLDGLPKGFVIAMRTLFDIMDDDRNGFVKYIDIEERWQDDGNQGLPSGVLENLKKLTPSNGLLSFDRFCKGLKISLLNIKSDNDCKKLSDIQQQSNRPPSAPSTIVDNNNQNKTQWISSNTATIRPNNVISQQRTLSMPQLHAVSRKESSEINDNRNINDQTTTKTTSKNYGPPKPPRTGAAAAAVLDGRNQLTMNFDRNIDKSEIRTVLQNWQMGLMMGEDNKTIEKNRQVGGTINYQTETTRNFVRSARAMGDGKDVDTQNNQIIVQQKKNLARRREPRRHTLQNGIDYNMVNHFLLFKVIRII